MTPQLTCPLYLLPFYTLTNLGQPRPLWWCCFVARREERAKKVTNSFAQKSVHLHVLVWKVNLNFEIFVVCVLFKSSRLNMWRCVMKMFFAAWATFILLKILGKNILGTILGDIYCYTWQCWPFKNIIPTQETFPLKPQIFVIRT